MKFILLCLCLLFLTAITLCDEKGTFVVNVAETSYQAVKNDDITLEWTFTTNTNSSPNSLSVSCELITDHKNSVLYLLHEGVESQDEQFAGRVQCDKDVLREGKIRLHVSRLRIEDSGLYVCDVRTNDGVGSGKCRLTVTAPIISATVGNSVLIPCSLPDPSLRFRWFHWQEIQSNNMLFDWVPNGQTHPIADEYKNRCQVFPTEFSSGNISIRLDNVAVRDDKKTFWAFVNLMDKKNLNKPSEQCCTFTLQVSDEEPKSYTSLVIGLGVGLSLSIIINIIIILLIVYRNGKHKRGFWNREIPPYERFAEENVPDAQPTLSRQNQYLENIPLRTRNGAETDDNPASGGGGAEHEKIR